MDELTQAKQLFAQSQEQFKSIGNTGGVVYSLEGLAQVAVRQHEVERAATLYAWADMMRHEMDEPRPLHEQVIIDEDMTTIREILPEGTLQQCLTKGRELTVDQAIHYALDKRTD